MKQSSLLRLCALCALFLCLFSTVFLLLIWNAVRGAHHGEREKETEWVYVYLEPSVSDTTTETEEGGWFLRVWGDEIGVFREDGTLVRVIGTNIKALPKTDRDLLEEGIYAPNKEALISLIEDYSE